MMAFPRRFALLAACACLAGLLHGCGDTGADGGGFLAMPVDDPSCRLNVVLVLDSSSSLGSQGWQQTKAAALNFVRILGSTATVDSEVGVVQFADGVRQISAMTSVSDVERVEKAVEGMDWMCPDLGRPCTFTYDALDSADAMLTNTDRTNVVITITDGRPNLPTGDKRLAQEKTELAAGQLLQKPARMMWVAVADAVNDDLRQLSSAPPSENFYEVQDFTGLTQEFIEGLVKSTCFASPTPPPTPPTSVTDPGTCEKDTLGRYGTGRWYTLGFAPSGCWSLRNSEQVWEDDEGKCYCDPPRTCAKFTGVFPLRNFGYCQRMCCTPKGSSSCFSLMESVEEKELDGEAYCCPPESDVKCSDI